MLLPILPGHFGRGPARVTVVLLWWASGAAAHPDGAARSALPPPVGKVIPNISIPTLAGGRLELRKWEGRLMVLAYVRQRQALSQRLLSDLQSDFANLTQERIAVVAIASDNGPSDYWRNYVTANGIEFPVGLDVDGRVLGVIDSTTLPVTLVVDRENAVAAAIPLHRASYRRDLWRRVRQTALPGGSDVQQRAADAKARQAALAAMKELARAGNIEGAVDAMARLRQDYPRCFALRMQLGQTLIELARPTEASLEFAAAEALDPSSLPVKLWLGVAHARNGAAQEAEPLLRGVADLLPCGWRAYGELGLIRRRQGKLEEALDDLRKSVAGQATEVWSTGGGWVGTGAPLLDVVGLDGRAGRPTVSGSKARPSIVLFWRADDEVSLACLRQLQEWHLRRGDREASIVAVNVDGRRFSDADRARVRAAVQAAGVTFSVWLDDELESFARYDVGAIPTTLLIDECGVVRTRVVGGDLSALAETLGAMAAAPDPRDPGFRTDATRATRAVEDRYSAMARQLARQRRIEAAIASARHVLAESQASAGTVSLLGQLFAISGRLDEPGELLAEATRDQPALPGLATAYADYLLRRGLYVGAEDWYHRALTACSDYGPARAGLGRLLILTGAPDQAARELQLAVELNPHDEWARISLAGALETSGRLDEALDAYETAYRMRWARDSVLARRR